MAPRDPPLWAGPQGGDGRGVHQCRTAVGRSAPHQRHMMPGAAPPRRSLATARGTSRATAKTRPAPCDKPAGIPKMRVPFLVKEARRAVGGREGGARAAREAAAAERPPPSRGKAAGRRAMVIKGGGAAALAAGAPGARAAPESAATVEELRAEIRAELLAEDAAARARVARIRQDAEAQGRASGGMIGEEKLCATPFGIDVVGITEAVALIGALVGGISARQRKSEVELLNEKLRRVNLSLRQQARAGTLYAPGLRYAPSAADTATAIPSIADALPAGTSVPAAEPAAAAAAALTPTPAAPVDAPSDTTEMTDIEREVVDELRLGKRLLSSDQSGSAGSAVVHFNKALLLSRQIGDRTRERRAVRGLAAARRKAGDVKGAITMLERVLEISKDLDEFTGDADALGTIADLYTELGDYERAGKFYDLYIQAMSQD